MSLKVWNDKLVHPVYEFESVEWQAGLPGVWVWKCGMTSWLTTYMSLKVWTGQLVYVVYEFESV